MPRLANRVFAGLSASTFSVLMSQTALAAVVSVHVPVPTIHVLVPTVHVAAPIVQIKAPVFKTTVVTTNRSTTHHDLEDGGHDRRGHGNCDGIASYRGTAVSLQSSLAVNRHGDLPKSGRSNGSQTTSNGVTIVTKTVQGTSVPPVELLNVTGLPKSNYGVQNGSFVPVILTTAEQEAANWFMGTTCSNTFGGVTVSVTIIAASPNGSGEASVVGKYNDGPGPNNFDGIITQNANGTYTLTIDYIQGTGPVDYTITFQMESGQYWTLINGVQYSQGQETGSWGVGNCAPTS